MPDTTLDLNARYRVDGRGGVAFYIKRYAQIWVPERDDHGWPTGEGEYEDDPDTVIMVIVGDDYEHTIYVSDLTPLADDDYCGGCGQIGCTHDGR